MTVEWNWTTALVALLSGAGLPAAYVALRLLPSQRSVAAVDAADKSVATMQRINDELDAALLRAQARSDYWKARAALAERELRMRNIPVPELPDAVERPHH